MAETAMLAVANPEAIDGDLGPDGQVNCLLQVDLAAGVVAVGDYQQRFPLVASPLDMLRAFHDRVVQRGGSLGAQPADRST